MALCMCGCGNEISKRAKKYVAGHQQRGKKHTAEHSAKIREAMAAGREARKNAPTRRCWMCKEEKPAENFTIVKSTGRRRGSCRSCNNSYLKEWNKKNKHRATALWVRRKYGISEEDYYKLIESQGGLCAICGAPPNEKKALALDHDHDTGKNRGLLCDCCNRGIGLFGDSVETMRRAIEYLDSHK